MDAADQMVRKRKESVGFQKLAQAGLIEHAWESVVLRHPDRFSQEAGKQSRERLRMHGVATDEAATHRATTSPGESGTGHDS